MALFWDANAFQCGFCLSGHVLCTVALLRDDPAADDTVINNALAGLCADAPATSRSGWPSGWQQQHRRQPRKRCDIATRPIEGSVAAFLAAIERCGGCAPP
jgi:hypothetical protein